ncbi:hypothetical protein C4J83_1040 [Pseudomonas sp. LBUM920]|jgi:hypothetical protein|nr:hypothetical protein C4J83_1040 [Pseudomonas sp. LBUM920]
MSEPAFVYVGIVKFRSFCIVQAQSFEYVLRR